ncbi:hypothetical protein BDN71DRAFT_646245 [Pleurotus eryngii]|uniref:Uncharacterized protein n=1 Tax=Pleurotus eryngii TaxID=5323 RepID=A0A9P6A064_PLEER|nr:hypothetical protein BDN71DRAFT_646245 [Pleurotus eryngii]
MLAAHVPAAQKKASRAQLLSDSSRAEFRKLRQIEIEKEQKLEEIEALQKLMDRSEHENLVKALSSVKTEFSDLDGIKWTRFRRQRPTPLSRLNTASVPTLSLRSFPSACTKSDVTADFRPIKDPIQRTGSEGNTFSHDDTIRVSSARWRYRTQLPSSGHSPLSQTFSESQSNLSASPTPCHDVSSSDPSANNIVRYFKPSQSDQHTDSDEETICIPVQQLSNALSKVASSAPHPDDNTETIRGLPVDQGTILAYSSQAKTCETDARPMVGRVFCREYECSPDGKRKPGTPGRWHAVEGLRVNLS